MKVWQCANCADTAAPHHGHGLCHPCFMYQWRNGVARPAVTMRQCVNCGQRERKGRWRQGLCARCYQALYGCQALGGVA